MKPTYKTTVIDKCRDLTIDGFIQCMFKKDYSCLIKSGNPSKDMLSDAWSDIFEEYARITGNEQYLHLLDVMRETVKLSAKLLVIQSSLPILLHGYDRETVINLKKAGFLMDFNPAKPEQYEQNLNVLLSRAADIKLKLQVQEKEVERISKENEKEKPLTESDYMDGIIVVGKFMQYRIDIKTVSIAEYASMQGLYKKYIKSLQRNGKATS